MNRALVGLCFAGAVMLLTGEVHGRSRGGFPGGERRVNGAGIALKDTDNCPVLRVVVEVETSSGQTFVARPNSYGEVVFENLSPGEYHVCVSQEQHFSRGDACFGMTYRAFEGTVFLGSEVGLAAPLYVLREFSSSFDPAPLIRLLSGACVCRSPASFSLSESPQR